MQGQGCAGELKDAASNLPVGNVASGGRVDADTTTRPQAAPAESGKLCAEAQAQAAAADTIQPAAVQVQVCSVEFKGAASDLP